MNTGKIQGNGIKLNTTLRSQNMPPGKQQVKNLPQFRMGIIELAKIFDQGLVRMEQEVLSNNQDIVTGLRNIQRELMRKSGIVRDEKNQFKLGKIREIGFEDFLMEILKIIDYLKLAEESIIADPKRDNSAIKSCLESFQGQKMMIFADFGITEMNVDIGVENFDSKKHEAFAHEYSEKPQGVIIAVKRTGYLFRDSNNPTKPFIYPGVIVSKGPQL